MDETTQLSHEECQAEFAALFPHGWAGADVLAEIAPQGWGTSPATAVFHPTADQVFEETIQIHRNMAAFPRKPDAPLLSPEPTREQIDAEYSANPFEPERECRELVGMCLWDIFSDNHTVIADDARKLDLGSMRSSGGFLAEVLNSQSGPPPAPKSELPPELMAQMFPPTEGMDPKVAAFMADMRKEMIGDGGYTYIDFYMGTGMISGRADLQPVYEMIFRRLFKRGMDWEYSFPRLHLVDLRPLKKHLDEQSNGDQPEWSGYDPSASFEEEAENQKKDEEIAEMREKLDQDHREAVEAARDREPPATVRAYRAVYGDFPKGWPPEIESE